MRFKFQVSGFEFLVNGLSLAILLLALYCSSFTVKAHEGEDHSKDGTKTTEKTGTTKTAPVYRAERNLQIDSGQFNVKFERVPSDPRNGELVQTSLKIVENVSGGFGNNEPLALDDANVYLNVVNVDGAAIAQNLPVKFENGFYRVNYTFNRTGNFKFAFNVTTGDKRAFAVEFPVTVTNAPINWYFWLGTIALGFVSLGAIGGVFYKYGRGENPARGVFRIAPFAVVALSFFAFGTYALAQLVPQNKRETVNLEPTNQDATPKTSVSGLSLTIPKESQLLFGITTETAQIRKITSGLKVTGTVRVRPESKGVVATQVAGKINLDGNLTIGAAVSKGERIGTIEQVLDVTAQADLQSKQLETQAREREITAQNLSLETQKLAQQNAVLELQARQAEQRAAINQAQTRLTQAKRELTRAANLVEVGAVPKKRFEDANTNVKLVEQEIAVASQNIKNLDNQIKVANLSQSKLSFRFDDKITPIATSKTFPIIAPTTGIITNIQTSSGSQVAGGTQILELVNLSTVLLEANVFEVDLQKVRESTRASFTSQSLEGEVYRIGESDGDGKLMSIGQSVNAQTRTIPVIYAVKNPLQKLRDGNFVEITIDTSGDAQVLTVPKTSVVNENGETFVFVFAGGESFERRAVALGAEGADFYEIKSGVKEGERVVTNGIYQLRSTQPQLES